MRTVAILLDQEELLEFMDKLEELSSGYIKINKRVLRVKRWMSSMFRLFRFTRKPIDLKIFQDDKVEVVLSVEEDLTIVFRCKELPEWVDNLDSLYNKYQLGNVTVL